MQEWIRSNYKGLLTIGFIGVMFALSEAVSVPTFLGRIACLAVVVLLFWCAGRMLESHYSRHPESTSFAVRRMRQ